MSNSTLDEIGRVRLDGRVFGVSINRKNIEEIDFHPVFQLLAKHGILDPDKADLENLAGLQFKMVIRVDDYKDEARELVEIPEICRYFQLLHAAWPYGLYFFNPQLETLQLLVWCNTGAKLVRNGEAEITGIQVPAKKLKEFIHSAMMPFFSIAGRLDFPPDQVSGQINEIAGMFETVTEDCPPSESDEDRRQRHHAFVRSRREVLANFAKSGFQEGGRGCVMILPPELSQAGGSVTFVELADLQAAGKDTQVAQLVERYDPTTQFVVSIFESGASSCSYTVKMP